MLLKSHNGCLGSGTRVIAGDAGLEWLPGCLVGGPGVTGGTPAGPGFDFAVGGVPEVYREDFGDQRDAPVAALPVSSAAGDRRREFLEVRFLQLKHRWRFGIPDFHLWTAFETRQYSPTTSGGGSSFCDFRRSMCSTACKMMFMFLINIVSLMVVDQL